MTAHRQLKSAWQDAQLDALSIEIEGFPVYEGERLRAENPIFNGLRTIEQFAEFARRLRGPFAIIVRQPDLVTAITDFGSCIPIYWIENAYDGRIHVSFRIANLRDHSCGELSAQAVCWWTVNGGGGPDPFYSDMKRVCSGSVVQIAHGRWAGSLEYIDWKVMPLNGPKTFDEAKERFIEIGTSYIGAVAKPLNSIACFLSGGIDSAICAYLAKRAGVEVVCLTANYAFARYSEFEAASRISRALDVEHRAVKVDYGINRRAMLRMNTREMDVPGSHSQLTSLVATGDAAIQLGLHGWLTGDNAGPLFLEFDTFYRGLPRETEAYEEAARQMSLEHYLARIGTVDSLDVTGASVLRRLGIDPGCCDRRLSDIEAEKSEKVRVFEQFGYPHAQVVDMQRSMGMTHQNCWLPAQRAVGHDGQILSPFLDIEMIRFGLSLPLNLKYRDGIGKWFLREFLRTETGLTAPKIASPNPSRVWWWAPRPDDLLRIDPRLRSLVFQEQVSNLCHFGRHYKKMFDLTAFGIWLAVHQFNRVSGQK